MAVVALLALEGCETRGVVAFIALEVALGYVRILFIMRGVEKMISVYSLLCFGIWYLYICFQLVTVIPQILPVFYYHMDCFSHLFSNM